MRTHQSRGQERRGARRKWSCPRLPNKPAQESKRKARKRKDRKERRAKLPPRKERRAVAPMQRHLAAQESRAQTAPSPRPARPVPPGPRPPLSLSPLARALSPGQCACVAGAATSVEALARTPSLARPYPACQAPVERPNGPPPPVPLRPHSATALLDNAPPAPPARKSVSTFPGHAGAVPDPGTLITDSRSSLLLRCLALVPSAPPSRSCRPVTNRPLLAFAPRLHAVRDTEPRRIWNCSRLISVRKPWSYRWALDLRIDVVHYCALLEHRRFLLDTTILSNWK